MRPTSRFLALAVPALLAPALLSGCAAASGDTGALGASAFAEPAAPGQPGAADAGPAAAPAPVTAPDAGPQLSVVAPRAPLTPVPPPVPDPASVARDVGATARDAVRPSVGSVGAAAPAPQPPDQPTELVQPNGGYAAALFSGVNAERVAVGLPVLRSNGCAQAAAQRWAEHLAATGDFAHQDIGAVLRRCSPATAAGENIARNSGSAGDVVSSWMASDGHRANILDGGYTHLGSAAVQMDDGRWVAVHVFLTL